MRSFWKSLVTLSVTVGLCLTMLTGTANAQRDDVTPLGGCVGLICGTIINQSSVYIYAIRDFDDSGPMPGTEWRILWPGEMTPEREDWDGVWVPCRAYGRLGSWLPPGWWYNEDWNSEAGWWHKIQTHQDLRVKQQWC